MSRPISQAEARRLKRRVRELEDRWTGLMVRGEFGGVNIAATNVVSADLITAVDVASKLGFITVARLSADQRTMRYFALK